MPSAAGRGERGRGHKANIIREGKDEKQTEQPSLALNKHPEKIQKPRENQAGAPPSPPHITCLGWPELWWHFGDIHRLPVPPVCPLCHGGGAAAVVWGPPLLGGGQPGGNFSAPQVPAVI